MRARPRIVIAGAGAAGLWTALSLIDAGWSGDDLCLVEPSAKDTDDRTWSYWAKAPLLPGGLELASFGNLRLRNAGRSIGLPTAPYSYYTLRSSAFYAYAKTRLAAVGVQWIRAAVTGFSESERCVRVVLEGGGFLEADYALDGRPLRSDLTLPHTNATLQHFGGWFVRTGTDTFEVGVATFMDFRPDPLSGGVLFFYLLPFSEREALVEVAVLSQNVWDEPEYDRALGDYLDGRFPGVRYDITEREYGVIPMTDEARWGSATGRIWPIGTRAGWVQPSSGYAFTRTRRFGEELAQNLLSRRPKAWRPSPLQQVFNSTMLSYILAKPERAGDFFLDLFARNGAKRTFDFLDERAGVVDTLRLMWSSPKLEFGVRALRETGLRILGRK